MNERTSERVPHENEDTCPPLLTSLPDPQQLRDRRSCPPWSLHHPSGQHLTEKSWAQHRGAKKDPLVFPLTCPEGRTTSQPRTSSFASQRLPAWSQECGWLHKLLLQNQGTAPAFLGGEDWALASASCEVAVALETTGTDGLLTPGFTVQPTPPLPLDFVISFQER